MRRAGQVAAATLNGALDLARPGVTTARIDAFVRQDTLRRGARCAQLGQPGPVRPFPAHVCTSVNDVVCHGVPGPTTLAEGDIINVDVTSELDGFHGDTSRTVIVGRPSPQALHVVDVARRALQVGIDQVRPGAFLNQIGAAIQAFVEAHGCSVVREYGGHGIGRRMHQPPHVAHHATAGRGLRLRPGHCFTIEPMVCLGRADLVHDDDGWTVRTADGRLSAQFEHTILVTADGAEVLTQLTARPGSPSPA